MSAKTARQQMDLIIYEVSSCGNFRTDGLRTAGRALRRDDLSPSVVARFHSKYDRTDGCWLWRAAVTSAGYGSLGIADGDASLRTCPAHRVAYVLAHGDLPAGALVMHSCDQPLCVNPAHLSLGSDRANVRDAIAKGRMVRRPDGPWMKRMSA